MGVLSNDDVVQSLIKCLGNSLVDLDTTRGFLKSVLTDESWRDWHSPNGNHRSYSRFIDFVVAEPWKGLGSTPDTLKELARTDTELLDMLDGALRNRHGGDRKSESINVPNGDIDRPHGNGRDAALRKLRDDAPELHAQVLAGELSPHKAMVTAGFRPHTFTVRADRPDAIARAIGKQLDDPAIAELVNHLTQILHDRNIT